MIKFTTLPTTFIKAYDLNEYVNSEFHSMLDEPFMVEEEVEASSDTYLVITLKKGNDAYDVMCEYTCKVRAFLQMMVNAGIIPEGKIVVDCTW